VKREGGVLCLIALISDMVREDCQFVIATHSPILMAIPGAEILSFDELPPVVVSYEDLEHVRITRDFLNNSERFLRHL
jgi:predicted ATPase